MNNAGFIFGGDNMPKTPQELARLRAVAQALAVRDTAAPKNIGEGLTAIGNALAYRSMMGDLSKAEAAGTASASDTMSGLMPLIGGGGAPAPVAKPPGPSIPPEALDPSSMSDVPAPMSGGKLSADAPDPADRQAYAMNFYTSRGYSPVQAAGIVGGLGGETANLNTSQTHDGGIGLGIAGWNGDRLAKLKQYADSKGTNPTDLNTQLEFVDQELKSSEGGAYSGLKAAQTPQQAGQAMLSYFRPKDWNVPGAHPERAQLAGSVFQRYGGTQIASNDPNFMPQAGGMDPRLAAMLSPDTSMQPQPMADPTAMAFNAQPQSANPLAGGVPPQAPPAGMQPFVSPQNMQTVQTRPTQLPIGGQPPQGAAAPQSAGPSPIVQQLMKAAQNPWAMANPANAAMVKALLTQELQKQDPTRQLDTQLKQAQLNKLTNPGTPDAVRVLQERAKLGGLVPGTQEYNRFMVSGGGANAGGYGVQPIWGQGKDGKAAILQLGKDGTPIQTPLPEGFSVARDPIKVEGPTGTTILDPQTRQIITFIPKDVRGAEREKGIGEQQGKEVAAAPGDIRAGENAMGVLNQIKSHEYIDRGTGFTSYGNSIRGTGGYDFENLVQGAKSGAFLQAIQQMRGLGSLSNAEGDAATRAINRMDTSTSKEAFLKAVDDYEKIVNQGMTRAKARLANPWATNPTGAAAQTNSPGGSNPDDPLGIR